MRMVLAFGHFALLGTLPARPDVPLGPDAPLRPDAATNHILSTNKASHVVAVARAVAAPGQWPRLRPTGARPGPGTIGGTNGTAEGDKPRGLLAMRGNQSCSAHSRETRSLGEVPAVSPR